MITDYFIFAARGIRARKLRSWLTILGIFIGIAAVVSLISIGQGMQTAISDQFKLLGSEKLIIIPGGGGLLGAMGGLGSGGFTDHDVRVIESVRGIDHADAMLYKNAKITLGDKTKYTYVISVPTAADSSWIFESLKVDGRFLREGDRYKTVVGYDFPASQFFKGKEVKLGDRININDQTFSIVGEVQKIGNRQDDSQVYIPLDVARDLFNEPTKIDMIYAKVKTGYNTSEVAGRVEEAMRKDRNEKVGEEDFSVQSSEQLLQSFSSIMGVVQTILVGIAAISLLVGGIGIMNTMYMSVMERTRQIGIMKAVGARNSDILSIFLMESGLLGLMGGIIGSILGIAMAKAVELYGAGSGFGLLKASITPELITFALAFSFGLGCLAGFLPARVAAKLKPVEALRYE